MNRSKKNLLKEKAHTYLQYLQAQPSGFAYSDKKSNAQRLATLKKQYKNCTSCPLGTLGRTHVVFGEGNPEAVLMFVGEGPGLQEDRQGKPFVGRAGQLLTKIINAMKLSREEVYIANVVKCRPPNNRPPLPLESNTCTKLLLFKQIDIIKPKIICALGASATMAFLGHDIRISAARGKFYPIHDYIIMPTYHPAYLLRNPSAKKTVWHDMQKILKKMGVL